MIQNTNDLSSKNYTEIEVLKANQRHIQGLVKIAISIAGIDFLALMFLIIQTTNS